METNPSGQTVRLSQHPDDLARLIRKLRWIGMDDEAQHLEMAVASLPACQRAAVAAEQAGTD